MKFCSYISLLLCVCITHTAQAQSTARTSNSPQPVTIGIIAGYNILNHSLQGQQLQGFPNCCLDFTDHTGSGIAIGGILEIPLTNLLRTSLRVGYQNLSSTLIAYKSYGKGELDNNVVDINTEQRLAAQLPALTVEPEASYRFFDRFGVHLGIRASYVLSPSYTYEEKIASGEFIFADTRAKTRHKNEADIPDASSLLLAGVAGISYELPMGRNVFAPEIRYILPITPLVENGNWKTSSLHIGAAFKIPLRSYPKLQLLRDTVYQRDTNIVAVQGIKESRSRLQSLSSVVDTLYNQEIATVRHTITQRYVQEVPKNELSVAVDYTLLSNDNTPLSTEETVIEEIESIENFPLLPYIFFPEGSSTLAATRQHLLAREEVQQFSPNALSPNALQAYPHFLNIIGARLRQHPKATIILTGCNNNSNGEKDNKALSQARAEAVKQYLVSVWEIEARRIAIKTRNLPDIPSNGQTAEGREENQRVEISTQHSAILQSLSIVDAEYVSAIHALRITAQATADAGIQTGTLYAEQHGTILATWHVQQSSAPISWTLSDTLLPYFTTPVQLVYRVTDSVGQQREAQQSIKVKQLTVQKKRTTQTADKRIESYQLIMFNFNSAKISAQDKIYLQDLSQSIKQKGNVQITIRGYTDRTGSAEYNKLLAERRCQEAMRILNTAPDNTTLEPIGSSTLLHDNSTPEGRFYSRTVEVRIQSPI